MSEILYFFEKIVLFFFFFEKIRIKVIKDLKMNFT
jgi:hypothetical protein